MDCVIYVRWSSAEQAKGSSLERQREDCRRHARAKNWKVVTELVDDGVSAFKGKHATIGALGKFVAAVEAGAYPNGVVLLTEKLDRLSREPAKKVFAWMLRVTELGVIVATVDGDRRYDSDSLDMAAIIEVVVKAQLANEESEKKATRLAAAWSAKRIRLERGETKVLTRRTPGWLRVEGSPQRFVVIPDRAAVVRRIFEETVAGAGKHLIARRLNQDNVPVFGRADGWHASYIQKILNSSAVLGEFQPGIKPRGESRIPVGDAIPDYYPRIIDPDLHAKAKQSMAGRQRRVGGRGRKLVNLFAGLATCEDCSARMTFRGKGAKLRANGELVNEDYLICNNYQRGLGCKNGNHYNYLVWEDGILSGILYDALEDKHFASPDSIRPLEIEHAERIRQRAASRDKAETALALYLETGRPEVKQSWALLAEATDAHDAAVREANVRLRLARGSVSPEEHKRRIYALRDTLHDPDEDVRFETRSRVMEAAHELVNSMTFSAEWPGVEIITRTGLVIYIVWEEWGQSRGTVVYKSSLDRDDFT